MAGDRTELVLQLRMIPGQVIRTGARADRPSARAALELGSGRALPRGLLREECSTNIGFAGDGARVASTAAEAGKGVEVLFTMLSNPEAVSSTGISRGSQGPGLLGSGGVLQKKGFDRVSRDCNLVPPHANCAEL